MKRVDPCLVGLGPAEGHEQKRRRPVLIVSPDSFNRMTKVPVVLHITSGGSFRPHSRRRRAAVMRRNPNHRHSPLRSTLRPRSRRTRRQETGTRAPRDQGRSAGEAGAHIRLRRITAVLAWPLSTRQPSTARLPSAVPPLRSPLREPPILLCFPTSKGFSGRAP